MTPAESRARLVDLRQRALAAGLTTAVAAVDARLAVASALAIKALEEALARPGLAAAHAEIVDQLDAPDAPPPAKAIPAPRRPGVLGSLGKPPPQPRAAQRKFTGPDEDDLKIPF